MNLFSKPSTTEASEDLQTLKVLYVEDNDDVRGQLSQFLHRRFSQVLIAQDGAEGLRLYTQCQSPPDLVFRTVSSLVLLCYHPS